MNRIILANMNNFTFSFPICISFISVSCLITLAKILRIVLVKNVEY